MATWKHKCLRRNTTEAGTSCRRKSTNRPQWGNPASMDCLAFDPKLRKPCHTNSCWHSKICQALHLPNLGGPLLGDIGHETCMHNLLGAGCRSWCHKDRMDTAVDSSCHSSPVHFHKCHSCRIGRVELGLEVVKDRNYSHSTMALDTSSCCWTNPNPVHTDVPRVFLGRSPKQRRTFHKVQYSRGCPTKGAHKAFLAKQPLGTNSHKHLTSHACNLHLLPNQIPCYQMGSPCPNHPGDSLELKSKCHSCSTSPWLRQKPWMKALKNILFLHSTRVVDTSWCQFGTSPHQQDNNSPMV